MINILTFSSQCKFLNHFKLELSFSFDQKEKMSQQMLSNRLETLAIYVCRGSISRIEDKSRTVTDIELYGLSQVLDTPIQDFFEE